ncbi:hydantoinase/oxoprolinase family protein [Halalkalicoccus jeotgali]|uniref:N-methylhydantoinase (ATP-hydrolyzing) A 2 n=1 Tax=Halalkalicoccus jeotgali (strain DSM 18796 / CECT 7217 / JCM 14584 / KCTC 4019 / B3) TaxID=795797 RepID=D8J7C6_HALJB|nr:hydantoinase/oxoprolinase family protein [Halalkalicoccus jeotgali]ADJ14021.1 N-methylhydantoinase (ATP-hydrolyzing) A 2 [Halalkalicoccus jeotgali B3]ELY33933.1 N-methylhydantoinase A 2 [Halalkalicoccus jeotgali B3]
MTHNLGVDVGGTFTDVIIFDETTHELTIDKVLSTPANPAEGVIHGIEEATAKADTTVADLKLLFHGTTVVTNMLLEEAGSRVGLVTTAGHEDVLHLARAWTPGPLYGWMSMEKPAPLADLVDTRGVGGRISSPAGEEIEPLDETAVREAVRELEAAGVESITVALLNAYLNPAHEQRVREIVAEEAPELPVSISSEIVPEYGEYERTLTTVINDYARPTVISYLDDLDESLSAAGSEATMNVVRSDGGLMSSGAAKERPVELALSGPSGGVVGAATIASAKGVPDVLTLDMGGTSTDVSLVEDGTAETTRQTKVGYREFKSRSVDVNTVGAGGGSIARVQLNGSLQVGPESAGADPGPACYGQGGEEPTVTDANVVLGRIPPSVQLGGRMELDREAARDAVATIADERGSTVEEAAQAILDIVNENMHGALRVVSVERGYDPREFGLVAFGGAGPMHANALADVMDTYPLLIPPGPGVMSAFGFLTSDIQNEFAETYLETDEDVDGADVAEEFRALEAEATSWLASEGVDEADHAFEYAADCRYFRQDIQMSIPVSPENLQRESGLAEIKDDFEARHDRQFGFSLDAPLEIANLRVIGKGRLQGVTIEDQPLGDADPSDAELAIEEVYFDGEHYDTAIYDRTELRPGNAIDGPAIVTDADSTVVVQPDHDATIDRYGNIEINRGENR